MRALRLESFAAAERVAGPDPSETETDARLATFEQGYAAGWDDASAAHRDERAATEEQVARALLSLSLTATDARRHVLHSLRPLIDAIATQLAPALARDSLAALLAETLLPLAEERAGTPVTIRLHPAARPAAEAHLSRLPQLQLAIVDDASLGAGQVLLSAGPAGARIDLDDAVASVTAAVQAFYTLLPTEH